MNIDERAVLIRIPRLYRSTMTADELYEATRKWWVMNPDRDPDYAFSIAEGEIKAVYAINGWEQPPPGERVGPFARRWAFTGMRDNELEQRYKGADVRALFRRGSANPITYVNC